MEIEKLCAVWERMILEHVMGKEFGGILHLEF